MAHLIDETTGKAAFMAVGEAPWHGLGELLDNPATAAEAIELAGLNYNVLKTPVQYTLSNDEEENVLYEMERQYVTYRSDTLAPLGVVGNNYTVVQNRDAFTFFDRLVDKEAAIYHTAGALNGGRRIFITAKMPFYVRLGDSDDIVEQYVLVTNNHDGRGSVLCRLTPIRVVCWNTLNMALQGHGMTVSIRHTSGAQEAIKGAHRVLGLSNSFNRNMETVYNRLSKVKVTDNEVRDLFWNSLASKKVKEGEEPSHKFVVMIDRLVEQYQTDDTLNFNHARGTLYGIVNAATAYFQHQVNHKNETTRLDSIMVGTARKKSQKVFEACMKKMQQES